jgi:PhnB protein
MLSINPYLNFMGNTEEAMNFYKSAFNSEFSAFQRFKESPGHEKMPEEEWDKIMHVSLPIGKGITLMATDLLESMGQTLHAGNNLYICIQAESEEETNKLFKNLSEGGKIEMPLNRTFWGAYCGMFRDKFGVQWMINCDVAPTSQPEKKSASKNQNKKTKK